MSLKTWLPPRVTEYLLSHRRLEKKRAAFEQRRAGRGEPPVLHYFHQRDAALLAAHYGLPPAAAHDDVQPSDPLETRAQADRLRQSLGHYLSAMLYYGGEWYWGIDRLHHLETRLQALGLQTDPADLDRGRSLFPPSVGLHQAVALRNPAPRCLPWACGACPRSG